MLEASEPKVRVAGCRAEDEPVCGPGRAREAAVLPAGTPAVVRAAHRAAGAAVVVVRVAVPALAEAIDARPPVVADRATPRGAAAVACAGPDDVFAIRAAVAETALPAREVGAVPVRARVGRAPPDAVDPSRVRGAIGCPATVVVAGRVDLVGVGGGALSLLAGRAADAAVVLFKGADGTRRVELVEAWVEGRTGRVADVEAAARVAAGLSLDPEADRPPFSEIRSRASTSRDDGTAGAGAPCRTILGPADNDTLFPLALSSSTLSLRLPRTSAFSFSTRAWSF